MKNLLATGGVVALALSMAGCDIGVELDAMALRTGDGGVELVTCRGVVAIDTYGSVEGTEFWASKGEFQVRPGVPIGLSAPGEGVTLENYDPDLIRGGSYVFFALNAERDIDGLSGQFDIPDSGLPTSGWLRTSGEVSSTPCPEESPRALIGES